MPRRELNREKVLDAALELASEEGLDGLSMRKLAKKLGVEAMSLYNHVTNKTDILDGIADRVYANIERPDPSLPWPERLKVTALSTYKVLKQHPAVPMALARDQANPTTTAALLPLDDMVGALFEAGLDNVTAMQTLSALNALVFGSLMLSTAGFEREFSNRAEAEQLEPYRTKIDKSVIPNFSRLFDTIQNADPERAFEVALDLLISGLVTRTTS
jgi:AcrR family transcriptional regulator